MKRSVLPALLAIGLLVVVVCPAFAQQQFVYPQKGQSAEQQKKEEPAKKDAEPTKDSAPVEQVTATIDSAGTNSKGIDSFMKELLG